MRASLKIALYLVGVAGIAVLAKADAMDAYIMPAGSFTKNLNSVESATRFGGRIEFGRFAKNIALDLRMDQGGGYSDFGGSFKAFGHWNFGAEEKMGLDFGGALLFLYSSGLDSAIIKQSFQDIGLSPFVRFTFDTGLGFGVMADVGMDVVFMRRFKETDAVASSTSGLLRMRPYLVLGIPIEI